jgi:molecular chaperone GrpE (heat shock protein)
MTQPIGELTNRMRDIFGHVVEAYLERGLPVGSKVLAGSINLSPASIRGVMQELEERGLLTHPHTSAGRIPTESGLRLFVDGIMQASAPDPRERAEIERQIVRDQPIEDALAAASSALSGLSQAAGVVLAPKQELRLKQLNFVPLSDTRALAILVGTDGTVENRIVSLDSGASAAALTEVSNFINARLSGLTLAEAEARLRAEIRDRKEAIDSAAAELVASGLAPRRSGVPHLHRLGEPDVRSVGLFGDRGALSREPGAGGGRCRGHRPDAVELCARGPHGGFHSESAHEIDGMKDEEQLHDEAEELRKETADGSPELAEHDRVAELEQQLEEANSKVLYAAAEIQNVRRRLEQEKQQASAYAQAGFAKDVLAIKDHLERALAAVTEELRGDQAASQFLAGIEATGRELEQVFARHGISRIKAIGEQLDPHRHQAMMEVPSDTAEPGTIVEEMQPGYMLRDRLLRPALVAVAKKA